VFIEQATYLNIVRVLREQPAHRRPNFLDASQKLQIDRRTIATGWERGWPATKDPRRPVALPPLKDMCAPGTELPEAFYPVRVPAPAVPPPAAPPAATIPSLTAFATRPVLTSSSGPSSEPSATAPSPEPGHTPAPAPAPPTVATLAPADPVDEIKARQVAFEAQEAKNLAGSLAVASHIASTGDAVLKLLYEAVTSPAAQERLRAFVVEKPERFPALLADLAKAVEASTKASERVFTMARLLQGKSTSIQEHRTDTRQPESPAEAAARIQAVMAELVAANHRLDDHGRPLGLAAIDVTPVDVTSVEETHP
jgi:hypothetical protein